MKADWTDVLYPLYLEYRQTFHLYLNRKISSLSPPPISALQIFLELDIQTQLFPRRLLDRTTNNNTITGQIIHPVLPVQLDQS